MQVAHKQEAKDLKESGLEGKDAFSELVKLSSSSSNGADGSNSADGSNGATPRNDPREDLERLYRCLLLPYSDLDGVDNKAASVSQRARGWTSLQGML